MDRALAPFKIVAAAWSGGVMLGKDHCDDVAYANLVRFVGETGDLPEDLADVQKHINNVEELHETSLQRMIARGLGVESVPSTREDLLGVLSGRECVPALAYDLTFAEVFYPSGRLDDRRGFDAVLGNPPWEQQEVSEPEFWAAYDLQAIAATSTKERDIIINNLSKFYPEGQIAWNKYQQRLLGESAISKQLYIFQIIEVNGKNTVGKPDVFKLFCEKVIQILSTIGYLGFVVPSSFHSSEGCTGIRRLFLEKTAFKICFSYENRNKLFEIDNRQKFAVIVTQKSLLGTSNFKARFYLRDDNWLFDEKKDVLMYSREFIKSTSKMYLNFAECNYLSDISTLLKCYETSKLNFNDYLIAYNLRLTQGFSVTRENYLLTPIEKNPGEQSLLVHEGKTFHQYQDSWETPIQYSTLIKYLIGKAHWLDSIRFFRLAFRKVASSTNERTALFAILPPGYVFTESVCSETIPNQRSNCKALIALAVLNSFEFDWLARLRIGVNVNFFLLKPLPLPNTVNIVNNFLAHSALRLTCNHTGYEPLWREQLGETWRESQPPFTFPVLASEDDRWLVRAAIDAVVADAYGLKREQYAHILSTFSHKSYPKAPQLCLACFDELQTIGLEAFTKKYDPYWNIPLNENLPKPVIDLPIPNQNKENAVSTEDGSFQLTAPPEGKTKRKRKK
ncbi:hypothetical protein F7734_17880 [Scytonema sp. UIC 10036]|uniref:Eco57I restriction-modification methylase domain-containing protein n=1 Tax=Scytonema sp. UIC 10036 TaxID=2304196 RepID=UPI0012DAADC0|nr:hypothetical protein [Scytonema sp. UIC 10036]MUG94155.1 hypothetical protein [Scytonema sp. UIC 10036]